MEHVNGVAGEDLMCCTASTNDDAVMMHGYCACWSCAHRGVHILYVASYTHALTWAHYCTSCTDMKRRVYETLQCKQNGGLKLA